MRLGHVTCLFSPTVLQPSDGAHAESYPLIHLANPHSWGPGISSRARLCWCQTLFISPFFQCDQQILYLLRFFLLKLWFHFTMVICLHVHLPCLPSPLPLSFFWGLISKPFLILPRSLKVDLLKNFYAQKAYNSSLFAAILSCSLASNKITSVSIYTISISQNLKFSNYRDLDSLAHSCTPNAWDSAWNL